MKLSVFPSMSVFGLSAVLDRPRKRLHVVLPFVTLLVEGKREFPPGSEPNLTGLKVDANEVMAGFEGGACAAVAAAFAAELDRVGAENYVQLDFMHQKHGPIRVTVQRAYGKTPATVASELRAELARLRGQMQSASAPEVSATAVAEARGQHDPESPRADAVERE